jgi:hypothetical protein
MRETETERDRDEDKRYGDKERQRYRGIRIFVSVYVSMYLYHISLIIYHPPINCLYISHLSVEIQTHTEAVIREIETYKDRDR